MPAASTGEAFGFFFFFRLFLGFCGAPPPDVGSFGAPVFVVVPFEETFWDTGGGPPLVREDVPFDVVAAVPLEVFFAWASLADAVPFVESFPPPWLSSTWVLVLQEEVGLLCEEEGIDSIWDGKAPPTLLKPCEPPGFWTIFVRPTTTLVEPLTLCAGIAAGVPICRAEESPEEPPRRSGASPDVEIVMPSCQLLRVSLSPPSWQCLSYKSAFPAEDETEDFWPPGWPGSGNIALACVFEEEEEADGCEQTTGFDPLKTPIWITSSAWWCGTWDLTALNLDVPVPDWLADTPLWPICRACAWAPSRWTWFASLWVPSLYPVPWLLAFCAPPWLSCSSLSQSAILCSDLRCVRFFLREPTSFHSETGAAPIDWTREAEDMGLLSASDLFFSKAWCWVEVPLWLWKFLVPLRRWSSREWVWLWEEEDWGPFFWFWPLSDSMPKELVHGLLAEGPPVTVEFFASVINLHCVNNIMYYYSEFGLHVKVYVWFKCILWNQFEFSKWISIRISKLSRYTKYIHFNLYLPKLIPFSNRPLCLRASVGASILRGVWWHRELSQWFWILNCSSKF